MNVLSLEQCVKLRELGLPQDTDLAYSGGELLFRRVTWPAYKEVPEDVVACPVLEELIEWLGPKRNNGVLTVIADGDGKRWHAYYWSWFNRSERSEVATGNTPLEAVYNAVDVKS